MLSKAAKNDIVKRFSEVFKANPSVMLVEYKGLTVAELEGLRSNLKDADTEFKIVKNKLLKIAAKDTEIEQINDLLVGPTAIAVCESDPTAAAKVFVKTAKDLPLLVIKGGVVEGNMVSVDDITAISKLPSRQEMMAQLLGALSSPMSNLLGAFTQMQSKLLYALEAVKDAKEETAAEESKVVEAVPESKEEAPVEAKEEAPVESKEESKEEKNEGAELETKAEEKTEIKEEDGAESTGQNEVDSKEES
jgi:large subunit ribosomal protein L10